MQKEIIKEAEPQDATPEGRQLLAQNIAIAAGNAVCFSAGVEAKGKKITYRKPPRIRKRL